MDPAVQPAPPVPPAAGVPGITDNDILNFLNDINGQDTYNAKADALGKLSNDHHLKVPNGFMPNDTAPNMVGRANARPNCTVEVYAQIYVMNKGAFGTQEEQVKGALLRAELVKAGWYTSTYEVSHEAVPNDYAATFTADIAQIREFQEEARQLAMLLPLASEFVFRTLGHHYLTGLKQVFVEKYTQFFAACVRPNLVRYLAPEILFHRASHWTSLSLALEVARHADNVEILPNAVIIRAYAAPAGTALVATSVAVLDAMDGTGLGKALEQASGADVNMVRKVTEAVKEEPGKYHVISTAYTRDTLSRDEVVELEEAKKISSALAPVLQGFIDALPKTSNLSGAKALAKHADNNPMLRKRAKAFFKEVGMSKATNMQELFAMDKRAMAATGGEDVVEDEDADNAAG